MKKVAFYAIMSDLYSMSTKEYVQYIHTNIINQEWFKIACRDKEIKISYFSRSFSLLSSCNVYAVLHTIGLVYSHKYLLLEFHLGSSHHKYRAKILNINLVNRSLFNLSALLVSLQKPFIDSNDCLDLVLYSRKTILELYQKDYDGYMDLSIISKIINFNWLLFHEKRFKLSLLLIKKNRLYAYYMQSIYGASGRISDREMSIELASIFGVSLSKRMICSVRQHYNNVFLLKASNNNYYDYEQNFTTKIQLNKPNISQIQWHKKGVYELLSKHLEPYPLASSNTVYIGSSKNIRQRLSSYVSGNGHTHLMRHYLLDHQVLFRIIESPHFKEYEMILMETLFKRMEGYRCLIYK